MVSQLCIRVLPVLTGLLMSGCAVPQAPTGGPPDEEPPSILESQPPAQATNVSPAAITLAFSEYVERSSLEEALSVTPPFEEDLSFDWDGRSVTVEFPQPLQDNTTYLVTIRTSLQDEHGVQLQRPLTVAFSTGPQIDQHTLSGRVVSSTDGRGVAAFDIFAYRIGPDGRVNPLITSPAFRTQTDENGRFVLEYLPDTTLFVAGVQDQNRNYRPDARERFAVPPRRPLSSRAPGAPDTLVSLTATRLDTVPPRIRSIQPQARERTRLTFDEPVRLQSVHPAWSLTPASTSDTVRLRSAYWNATTPRQITVLSEPLDSVDYHLRLSQQVVDSSHNVVEDTVITFTGSASPDTLTPRVEEYLPLSSETPYPADVRPGLRLNRPISMQELAGHAAVADSLGTSLQGNWTTRNGTEYRFSPEQSGVLEDTVTITVQPPLTGVDSVVHHSIRYFDTAAYGSISGAVVPGGGSTVVTARPTDEAHTRSFRVSTDSTGRFHIRRIPEGSYRIRAFQDANRNERWDGGLLHPYEPSEPVLWSDSVRVRARWETDLDTLHAPSFRTNP